MAKKTLCTVLLAALMLACALPASAAAPDQITPLWDNIATLTPTLIFYNNTGYLSVTIQGENETSNITATARLYYKSTSGSWIEISQNWDYDVDQTALYITETFSGVSGREYKVEIDIEVTVGNYTESESVTVTATC